MFGGVRRKAGRREREGRERGNRGRKEKEKGGNGERNDGRTLERGKKG